MWLLRCLLWLVIGAITLLASRPVNAQCPGGVCPLPRQQFTSPYSGYGYGSNGGYGNYGYQFPYFTSPTFYADPCEVRASVEFDFGSYYQPQYAPPVAYFFPTADVRIYRHPHPQFRQVERHVIRRATR